MCVSLGALGDGSDTVGEHLVQDQFQVLHLLSSSAQPEQAHRPHGIGKAEPVGALGEQAGNVRPGHQRLHPQRHSEH